MKKNIILVTLISILCVVVACGSSWQIQGNSINIYPVEKDTVVKAGSYILVPDSLR